MMRPSCNADDAPLGVGTSVVPRQRASAAGNRAVTGASALGARPTRASYTVSASGEIQIAVDRPRFALSPLIAAERGR